MKSNNQPGHNSANRQKRRFVRIEVFSPVSFNSVVVEPDKRVRLHPEKNSGVLLNLSGGGVLVSTTDHVTEGEFLLMKFDVHGFDALTNVIGKDIDQMSDFDAIRYAEELKRPSGSKVNAWTLKMARLGLKDNDIFNQEIQRL